MAILTDTDPVDLEVDFGYRGVGALGDTVFFDLDGAGGNEPVVADHGIPGVTVTVTWTNPTGGPDFTAVATTDADGTYTVEGLPDGDYVVTVDPASLPAGVVPVHDPDGGDDWTSGLTLTDDPGTLVVESVDVDQDFSVTGTGSLGDTVWNDVDGDGIFDTDEEPLGGVAVTLTYTDPVTGLSITGTTVTAGDGTYGFTGLPAGEHVVSVDADTLPDGYAPTFDLDATDLAPADGTATLTLGPGDDRDDVDFGYRLEADLELSKSHEGDFEVEGEGIWTFAVTNGGPGEAEGPITVTDDLPVGIDYLRVESDDWVCTDDAGRVACTLVGEAGQPLPLPAGESVGFDLVVAVDAEAASRVVNTATVESPTTDPDPDNNTATDPVAVPLSVLTVDKSLTGTLVAGQNAVYRIVVTNTGPSITRGTIRIVDVLPGSLTYVAAEAPMGTTCSGSGQTVTCLQEGTVEVGESVTILLTVRVATSAGGTVQNIVTVSGGNEVNGTDLPVVGSVTDDAVATVLVPPPTGNGTPPSAGGSLPTTGSNTMDLVASGLGLLVVGAALSLMGRRRRPA